MPSCILDDSRWQMMGHASMWECGGGMTTVAVPSIFMICCSSHGTTTTCCTARLGPTIPGSCVMISENQQFNSASITLHLRREERVDPGIKAVLWSLTSTMEVHWKYIGKHHKQEQNGDCTQDTPHWRIKKVTKVDICEDENIKKMEMIPLGSTRASVIHMAPLGLIDTTTSPTGQLGSARSETYMHP